MTSVVIGDMKLEPVTRSDGVKGGKEFADIFTFFREALGAVGVLRIIAEEVRVFLHSGTATGGVDDNGVNARGLESIDSLLCQSNGKRFVTRMGGKGSAAGLVFREDNFTAFRGEYASGGGVYLGKEFALDAAKEEADAAALCGIHGGR